MRRLFCYTTLFLIAALGGEVRAQVTDYARYVVDSLASDAYKGRGYVGNGDKLAAAFIRNEFQKAGLKSFNEDYFQPFEVSVNTFPEQVYFRMDDTILKAGTDFIINPGSPSIKGEFNVVLLNSADLLSPQKTVKKVQRSAGKVLVIEAFDSATLSDEENRGVQEFITFLTYSEEVPAAAVIIFSQAKLTWHTATALIPRPVVTVHADSASILPKKVELNIASEFNPKYTTQNVIGYIEGTQPDSVILLMAHYDHLGMMGSQAVFNGANDNASGTAMLLSVARYFSEHPPRYTIVFIAFGAEELGLKGSAFFVENPLFDLSRIAFLLNFDIAGTGDDGIQVVNGSVYTRHFEMLTELNNERGLLPQIKTRGRACNSDHCVFDALGIPGFFIYTLGGIPAYHDVYDRPETLPLTRFEEYFTLMVEFIQAMQGSHVFR